MKQTKKQPPKGKPTKNQPINVQLSKDDLKELLTVLKDFICEDTLVELQNFIREEFEQTLHLHHHRMDCLTERITTLEYSKTDHQKEIHKLKQHCLHDDKLDSINYYSTGAFFAVIYKCKRCGKENWKTWGYLTQKEKRALRKLGIKIS